MLIGYVRVSILDQDPALQLEALKAAGCERIFQETALGARQDRPQLAAALEYLRSGGSLVVWSFDQLAHSTRQLIETMEELRSRGSGSNRRPGQRSPWRPARGPDGGTARHGAADAPAHR